MGFMAAASEPRTGLLIKEVFKLVNTLRTVGLELDTLRGGGVGRMGGHVGEAPRVVLRWFVVLPL